MSISLLSTISAVATLTLLSSALEAEPLKTKPLILSATSLAWNGSAPASTLAQVSKSPNGNVRSGPIASAIIPLDLRKLTMSDFGDVEGLR